MEVFKTFLFGVAGLSMIFWVAVIGLWHVDMFPRFFKEDRNKDLTRASFPGSSTNQTDSLLQSGALRPAMQTSTGLVDRAKYSRKSIVVADFSPIESDYSVNRLYTSILFALGIMSFIFLTYGLHSALTQLV